MHKHKNDNKVVKFNPACLMLESFQKKHAYEIDRISEVLDVAANDILLPIHECQALISAFETPEPLANADERRTLAGKVMVSWNYPQLVDMKSFTTTLADEVFVDFSYADGLQAIKNLIRKLDFPPQPGQLYAEMEAVRGERGKALYAARKHLEAHRLRLEQKVEEDTPLHTEEQKKRVSEMINNLSRELGWNIHERTT